VVHPGDERFLRLRQVPLQIRLFSSSHTQIEAFQRSRDSLLTSSESSHEPRRRSNNKVDPETRQRDAGCGCQSQIAVSNVEARVQSSLDGLRPTSGASRIASAFRLPNRKNRNSINKFREFSRCQGSFRMNCNARNGQRSCRGAGRWKSRTQLANSPVLENFLGNNKLLFCRGSGRPSSSRIVSSVLLDNMNGSVRKRSDIERRGIPVWRSYHTLTTAMGLSGSRDNIRAAPHGRSSSSTPTTILSLSMT